MEEGEKMGNMEVREERARVSALGFGVQIRQAIFNPSGKKSTAVIGWLLKFMDMAQMSLWYLHTC